MLRFSKTIFWAIVAVLLLWQLPWCYNFLTAKAEHTPFTLYSTITGDFALLNTDPDKGLIRQDRNGNTFTEEQFDSILPAFYVRQLVTDERFPDSIAGVAVTPRLIQTENFSFRLSPSTIAAPQIGLYPLLESMSGRVDLKMPEDVFRITDSGIEFIVMKQNAVDEQKSLRFTEAMKRKGFRFPATDISGNPTARKEYDEGYVILDADRKLFHLKQVKGRPYCRAIELPEGMTPEKVIITEFTGRHSLAFIVDTEHKFWVVRKPSYEIVRTGIPSYDPKSESIMIIGNMFDWTVNIADRDTDRYYAIDASDFSLLDTISYRSSIKPLKGLRFTSSYDRYVYPHFE